MTHTHVTRDIKPPGQGCPDCDAYHQAHPPYVILPEQDRAWREMAALGQELQGEQEWSGDVHVLTVLSVTPPLSQFDDGELDYEIAHAPSCQQETVVDAGGHSYRTWTCDIARDEEECGLAFSLRYSGTPVTAPDTYRIRHWGRKTYHHEYGWEYDGGTGVIMPGDEEGS